MDQMIGSGLVKFLDGQPELLASLFRIPSLDCRSNFTDVGSQSAPLAAVGDPTLFVLTKPFLGVCGIWHDAIDPFLRDPLRRASAGWDR
jgi:hypothetical protein